MLPSESRAPAWHWAAPLSCAVLLAALAAASPALAPNGAFPEPWWMLAALLAAAAGALHRPLGGGSLSLGALVVFPGFERLGILPTALAAGAALVVAELALRAVEARRETPLPERRTAIRVAAAVSVVVLGIFAAGGVWLLFAERPVLAGLLAGLAWLVPPVAYEALARRARRLPGIAPAGEKPLDWVAALLPLAFDLAGLAAGGIGVALARRAGWPLALAALAGFALFAAEAARNALAASGSARRLEEAHRLRRAGVALAAGGAGVLAVAEQIRAECAQLLSFSWFQLDLDLPGEERMSWGAEAGASLSPGAPSPPPVPPALPGIHRRTAWQILERPLGDSQALGRVRLWCDPRRIDPRALELFEGLRPQMAASLREALADRAAKVDALTGAATRRVLERRLEEAYERSLEDGSALALVLCDLDHFKRINDTFGHPTGDAALKAVASVLLAPSRGDDLCARYGGEEFVLLFENTSGETALEIAERLRGRVEALAVESPSGAPVPLTMSAGVAAVPELAARSSADLLHLADQALYTAKHLGRNVCLLDIGQGRLRTPNGEIVDLAPEAKEIQPPVFFA